MSNFRMGGFPNHQNASPLKQKKAKLMITQKAKHGYKVEGEEGHHAFRSDLTFPQAFRVARDAGVKSFWWRGKDFTTEVK